MSSEIDSTKMSQVTESQTTDFGADNVQTPTEDFLEGATAADPESFNVCISCD